MTRSLTVSLAVVGALALTACGTGEDTAASAGSGGGMTAQTLATDLATIAEMPNPRDTTHTCSSKDLGVHACEQMITTDTLSVYQLRDSASAEHWSETLAQRHTVATFGPFLLQWQYEPSPDAFAEITNRTEELVG
ncbi:MULTISPECIES: hypothetical protein [unclassified Streptomyces]|uniref:hypothetical protein n=1 Tax=unclassified Streptomyces TaxID=2593676 RepID=UPI000CD58D41|nr:MULTISPECIES: hypothetical protein [unclassified Streptomyces]